MKDYEVMVEDINPCGGADRPRTEFIDVRCDDPVEWVRAHCRFPVREANENSDGDLVITAGDSFGLAARYTFSEC
ncbi:MAG: hypothetical protein KBS46_02565 [Clostridiales bacterium]|nr:hypothetical protein [Candidatus Apopatocola equi]MCQ2439967.1 hypothetical protein [Oscillospiraceae bacterium]